MPVVVEQGEQLRLTKDRRKALLMLNEGFEDRTDYSAKNFSETRDYKIVDGQLEVRSRGKTSWADSRFDKTFVADDEATHRFLRKHLPELNTEGIEDLRAQLAAERASQAASATSSSAPEPLDPGVPVVLDGVGPSPGRPVDVNKVALWVGFGVLAVTAVVEVAPHAMRLWQDQLDPRLTRLRGRFFKARTSDAANSSQNSGDGQDPMPGPLP